MKNNKNITQQIVAIAIGSALFAVLMNYGGISIYTNTKLTTAYIIPVIIGAFFGPIPAALVGFIGNFLADTIGGWGYWFDWSFGNLFCALFIGSLNLYGVRIREGIYNIKHAIIFSIIAVLGNAVSFGLITPFFTKIIHGGELVITLAQAQVAVLSNSVVILIVGNIVLFALARRYKKQNNLVEE